MLRPVVAGGRLHGRRGAAGRADGRRVAAPAARHRLRDRADAIAGAGRGEPAGTHGWRMRRGTMSAEKQVVWKHPLPSEDMARDRQAKDGAAPLLGEQDLCPVALRLCLIDGHLPGVTVDEQPCPYHLSVVTVVT